MALTQTVEIRAAISSPYANDPALTCVVWLAFTLKLKWIKAHFNAADVKLEPGN